MPPEHWRSEPASSGVRSRSRNTRELRRTERAAMPRSSRSCRNVVVHIDLCPLSSVVVVMVPVVPPEPASACTYGVVRERKVAITGLAIRASCRCFRIAGYSVSTRRQKNTSAPTYPEPDGEPYQSEVIIGCRPWLSNLTKGQLNHGGNRRKLLIIDNICTRRYHAERSGERVAMRKLPRSRELPYS